MKRWLIVVIIATAVVLLLSPGIIGRLAERNIDSSLSRVDLENDDILIEAEAFSRGWFTSAGRHRVVLQGGLLAELVAGYGDGVAGTPAVVIETRVDHGLLPVTSMQRERGSLSPALANAVSTFRLDRGDGELTELPGRVYTFLGLVGDASFRLLVDAGRHASGNTDTAWEGAELTFSRSSDNLRRAVEGSIEAVSVESFEVRTETGRLTVDAEQDRSEHELGETTVSLELASLEVRNPGDPDLHVGPLSLTASNEIDGDRSDGRASLQMSMRGVPRYDEVDVSADVGFRRLDADALAVILGAWRTLYGPGGGATEAELMAVYPALRREFEALAAAGGHFEVPAARVVTPQGDWQMAMTVDVDETAGNDGPFSWPSVLLNTTARLDIDLSTALFDHLVALDPDMRSALATGLLVRQGDRYEMKAGFDNGHLTINGAPMTIPLGEPLQPR